MAISITVTADNGQVQIEGPLNNIPMCLDLLAAGTKMLFQMQGQKQAQNEPRPLLYMPDGSPARIKGTN